jgi:hypothetical protein
LRDRVTGKAETIAKTKAFKEASGIIDILLDSVGWETLNSSVGTSDKRTVKMVSNSISKNIRKYNNDGYVKRGINLHTDFVVGRGIDVPKCKSDQIQEEIINPFWYSATNQRNFFGFVAQQRRHKEFLIAGELNILIKIDPQTSCLKLYPIQPQDILEVITDPEEKTRPAYYLVKKSKRVWNFQRNEYDQQTEERVLYRALRYKLMEATDADLQKGLIYHTGMNEFFDSMRGMSDISTVYDAAESARDMADDGASLSRANAETAYKVNVLKGGKTVKDAYLSYVKTKTDGSNPAGAPASDWVQDSALDRDWMEKRDTGAAFREKDMRAQKLIVFAGMGFGEHYMGDPSSGNLATATAMELPVLKMIQAEQKYFACVYNDLSDFAIDIAVVTGKLGGNVVDPDEMEVETDESRTFTVKFPPITQKQIDSYITALATTVDKNLIPEETAARIAMEAFEVEDIDEALDELYQSKEVDAALAKIQAQDASAVPPSDGESQAQGANDMAPQKSSGSMPPGMPPMEPMTKPAMMPAGGNGNGGSKK